MKLYSLTLVVAPPLELLLLLLRQALGALTRLGWHSWGQDERPLSTEAYARDDQVVKVVRVLPARSASSLFAALRADSPDVYAPIVIPIQHTMIELDAQRSLKPLLHLRQSRRERMVHVDLGTRVLEGHAWRGRVCCDMARLREGPAVHLELGLICSSDPLVSAGQVE